MRKTSIAAALAIIVALAGAVSIAGEDHKAATQSWNGWITDETCGAKNANAEGKACALSCAKAGAKLVLYVDGDKTLVALDNQTEAMKHVGYPVTVTGTIEDGVIKVQKIEQKKG